MLHLIVKNVVYFLTEARLGQSVYEKEWNSGVWEFHCLVKVCFMGETQGRALTSINLSTPCRIHLHFFKHPMNSLGSWVLGTCSISSKRFFRLLNQTRSYLWVWSSHACCMPSFLWKHCISFFAPFHVTSCCLGQITFIWVQDKRIEIYVLTYLLKINMRMCF